MLQFLGHSCNLYPLRTYCTWHGHDALQIKLKMQVQRKRKKNYKALKDFKIYTFNSRSEDLNNENIEKWNEKNA